MKTRILIFCTLFFTISLQGQSRVIKGHVTDQEGQVLADKRVEARYHDCSDETNQEIIVESVSDEEGYYELWLDICDDEEIVVIAYCGDEFQSVDIYSFGEGGQEINFNFDCNYDYNCDASFSFTYGDPIDVEEGIPFYFTAINPNEQDYFYEWAFLGALGEAASDLDTPTIFYPTYGQYTVCMQSYIIGDPYNIICEFCESINADLAYQAFQTTNVEVPLSSQLISLSPNPTNSEVQLEFNLLKKETLTIEINNLLGQVLKQQHLSLARGENQLILDFNDYRSGVYLINVKSLNGSFTRRIVKE